MAFNWIQGSLEIKPFMINFLAWLKRILSHYNSANHRPFDRLKACNLTHIKQETRKMIIYITLFSVLAVVKTLTTQLFLIHYFCFKRFPLLYANTSNSLSES